MCIFGGGVQDWMLRMYFGRHHGTSLLSHENISRSQEVRWDILDKNLCGGNALPHPLGLVVADGHNSSSMEGRDSMYDTVVVTILMPSQCFCSLAQHHSVNRISGKRGFVRKW